MFLFLNLLCILNLLPNMFGSETGMPLTPISSSSLTSLQTQNGIYLLTPFQKNVDDIYITDLHQTDLESVIPVTAVTPLALAANVYNRLVERLEYLWEWMDTYNKKDREDLFMHHSKLPVYLGLIFGLLLIFIFMAINHKENTSPILFWCMSIVFLALCGCEVLQFLGYHGDHTWFCSHDKVGWWLTILNFAIFAAITLCQIFAFYTILVGLDAYTDRNCNWGISLYIIGIGFIMFFLGSAFFKPLFVYGGILFLVTQICWAIWLIYANITQHGNWLNLLTAYCIYLIGGFCIFITLAHLVALAFLFIIGALLLIPKGHDHTPTIYVKGEGHITGRGYNGGVNFHGDNGREYEYDGNDWHPAS